MKRKKLIAALTSAVMAVTMLPSIAMASGTPDRDLSKDFNEYTSVVKLVDVSTGDINADPVTKAVASKDKDAYVSKYESVNENVKVVMEPDTKSGKTVARFMTEKGKKLPYVDRFGGFTDYVENWNSYQNKFPVKGPKGDVRNLDDLIVANGHYVKCLIIPGKAYPTAGEAGGL